MARRENEDQVNHLESEEVREVDWHDKKHQLPLVFGKMAHR